MKLQPIPSTDFMFIWQRKKQMGLMLGNDTNNTKMSIGYQLFRLLEILFPLSMVKCLAPKLFCLFWFVKFNFGSVVSFTPKKCGINSLKKGVLQS